uniref:Ovule protein n=1 Tax=Mesocestoides corti TaxID=53468 RepID=A0A5K3G0H4_MESCO
MVTSNPSRKHCANSNGWYQATSTALPGPIMYYKMGPHKRTPLSHVHHRRPTRHLDLYNCHWSIPHK